MQTVFETLVVLYVFLFLGWLFGKIRKDLPEYAALISFFIVNLFLPSKLFRSLSKNFTVTYLKENYVIVLAGIAFLVLLILLAFPVARFLTKDMYDRKVYRYSVTICNYAYLGYVLVEEAFGLSGLTSMILFCIPFSIYTNSFGYLLLTEKKFTVKNFFNTITMSLLFGMAFGLFEIPIPAFCEKILSNASACAGPLAMLVTGLILSTFSFQDLFRDKMVYVMVFLRLVGIPSVLFGLCKLFRLDGVILFAVLMSCMPGGLNPIVFPKLVGKNSRVGASLALISHILAMVTVPLWVSLVL